MCEDNTVDISQTINVRSDSDAGNIKMTFSFVFQLDDDNSDDKGDTLFCWNYLLCIGR